MMADCRSSSSSTERPLNHTLLPSRCEGQVSAAEPPFSAGERVTVDDPVQSSSLLGSGRSRRGQAVVDQYRHVGGRVGISLTWRLTELRGSG